MSNVAASTLSRDLDIQIGGRLRTLRQSRRKSLSDLAKVLGVSYQQIQKYEVGAARLTPFRLFLLSRHFGVSLDQLFGVGPIEFSPYLQATAASLGSKRIEVAEMNDAPSSARRA